MNEIKQFFGKNLKRLRVSKGYTQERLSELIGINQRQLTRIETGKSFPSFTTLDSICNALCISADELFNFSDFCELKKDGTNNILYYTASKTTNNVVILKEKFPQYYTCENSLYDKENSLSSIEVADEDQMSKMSVKLQKPIFVEYIEDGVPSKKIIYNPDGTSSVEIKLLKNEKLFNKIIDDINNIKSSMPKLKFLNLALKCFDDKSSIEKMQNILEGMSLKN